MKTGIGNNIENMNEQLLNWLIDDGISIRLITDKKRNQFYETIIKDSVNEKHCVDVGFGTGILSLLAIKHGAKSVRAYESNVDRYELGLEIIKHCGLNDKIELINNRFDKKLIRNSDEIIIHEIIGATMYNEGLHCLFNDKIPVLPANYRTDFLLYEVSNDVVESLNLIQNHNINLSRTQIEYINYKNKKLSLGIDIGEKYEEKVFELIDTFYKNYCVNGIQKLDPKSISDFTDEQRNLFYGLKDGKVVCSIPINYKETESLVVEMIDKDILKNKTFIILPKYYFSHNGITFDMEGTHWNERIPWQESAILKNIQSNLYIRQNLTNGKIDYWIDN